MLEFTQTDRPLRLSTPLEQDVLLIAAFRGEEAISRLFRFEVEMVAEVEHEIKFEAILGQSVTVELELADGEKRYFNGIVRRFSKHGQERSGDAAFNLFRAELTPRLWFLTKKVRSRVFQQLSVPDILRKVLTGLHVEYELAANYHARNYCVQYGESDFAFASRLMEEEGIQYFFKHQEGQHQMVVTDRANPRVCGQSDIRFERAVSYASLETRVNSWEKSQELVAGEYELRDHCFELPHNPLEAKQKALESIPVGQVTHKLRVAANEPLQIYEYPGGYAQRFDGIGPGGAARPDDLERVFEDRERTVRIRMEQEEALSFEIKGSSNCGQFSAGHKFELSGHGEGDGEYLLTKVEHEATQAGYMSREGKPFEYKNSFRCAPSSLPWRPQRTTPKPLIAGFQTATVTGTPGEEIFCDKYGRVKAQFHWDREGKMDEASSCWIRVAQVWAGKGWGAFFWPRIGHEVVVAFEEGDPDKPLIVGSVYNAENMPWFALPVNKQLAGFKSASVRGNAHKNFNGIVFNDHKGHEHLAIHSERNLSLNSETDKMIHAGRHKGERVALAHVFTVGKLIPGGGGSGGGYDEGNPFPSPAPYGALGLNSVFVLGNNMQAACPLNHQLTLGSNIQICINPLGLLCGLNGVEGVKPFQALMGSGMGGSMQFTVGTSAQFTLGQSFEISVGPPKIEIHEDYSDFGAVKTLCKVLSIAALVFGAAYEIAAAISGSGYSDPQSESQTMAEQQSEQGGDSVRALLVVTYQLLADVVMTEVLKQVSLLKDAEWQADDYAKKLSKADADTLELWKAPNLAIEKEEEEDGGWWSNGGGQSFGSLGVFALVGAELALAAE